MQHLALQVCLFAISTLQNGTLNKLQINLIIDTSTMESSTGYFIAEIIEYVSYGDDEVFSEKISSLLINKNNENQNLWSVIFKISEIESR